MRLPESVTKPPNSPIPLDPATLALLPSLRDRHITFIRARLVSPKARDEWRHNLTAGWAALLATPVGALIDGPKVAAALESTLDHDHVRAALRPALRSSILLASARMREDQARIGHYVPAGTTARLDELLERPGLVPERLLREIIEHDAMESVMRDVLFETLTEFSEKVNPFFAEWGLPGLLKRLSPFGLGGMSKAFESVRAEFDRRLVPEIRKFLQGFSRRALGKFADFIVAEIDQPGFVALRKSLAAWILAQEVATVAPAAGDESAALAEEIALDIVEHVLTTAEARAERRAALELAVAAHAKQSLAEAMAVYGVTVMRDLDAIAEATWPAFVAVLESEPVSTWLAQVVGEFYDELAAGDPAGGEEAPEAGSS